MPNLAFQKSLRSKDKDKFVASLRYGGIPMAATGIGIEEIKVTHADGGGGRDFSGFRGSGKEYAMNYEPSRGSVEQGGTGSQQPKKEPKEEPKEETPEIEEIVVTSVRENFNSFMNEENPVFNYNVTNFLNPESLQSISSFTQGNDNVSEIDVYSILFAESSGGQRENPAASGPLQVQLGAFIDSQRHQNIYGPVPPKDTPEHKIYMEKAEKDFNALDQTGYVETGLNYLESLNQRFERNNKRKPTIEESALLYTEGYKGGMKYIEGEKNWRESTKLKVYIPNVLKAYTALTVKDSAINFEEGGTPWGGATGTIYEEPSGPKPLQQQMINAFSNGGIGLEEIVVKGTRDSNLPNFNYTDFSNYSANNPNARLFGDPSGLEVLRSVTNDRQFQEHMDYLAEMKEKEEEDNIEEEESSEAKIGGGKDVFGQPKGTKKTEEEYDYGSPVSDDTSEKVSIEEGLKNFADNIKDTFGNPEDTWEDAKEEFKIFVDNLTSKVLKKSPALAEALEMQDNNLRPFGTDVTNMAIGNMVQKYSTPEKFVTAFKNNPVGTITDIGLVALGTLAGTRTGGLGSVPFTLPLVNKYSQ